MNADLFNCRAVLFISPIVIDPDFVQRINGLLSRQYGLMPNVYQELQLPTQLPNLPNGVQLNIAPAQVMEMKKPDNSFSVKFSPSRIDIVQNRTQNDSTLNSYSGFIEKINPICALLFENLGLRASRLALASASIINAEPYLSFPKLAKIIGGEPLPIEWEIRQVQRKEMEFDSNCILNLSIKHNMSLSFLVGEPNTNPSHKIIQELDFNTIPERVYNYENDSVSAFFEEVSSIMTSYRDMVFEQLS